MLLLKNTNTIIHGYRSLTSVFVNKIININRKNKEPRQNKQNKYEKRRIQHCFVLKSDCTSQHETKEGDAFKFTI